MYNLNQGPHWMHRLIFTGKLMVAIATLWVVCASGYIFFTPITVQGVTSTQVFGNAAPVGWVFAIAGFWFRHNQR